MISWWNNLGLKGKLYFFGCLDVAANLGIIPLGFWFPVMTYIGVGLVVIGFVIPKSWDE